MGLFLSCVSVFLRDVFYIYGIVLTIWNYLTPVFYSVEILPLTLQKIMNFNPLYQFLTCVRKIVVYGEMPSGGSLIAILGIGIGTLLFGAFVFRKNQDKYIYYV
jgi:ABC-2 type transport system permease protein